MTDLEATLQPSATEHDWLNAEWQAELAAGTRRRRHGCGSDFDGDEERDEGR